MTINGPAPMILAMFMNTAIDQRVERYLQRDGGWTEAQRKIAAASASERADCRRYRGELPEGHDGFGTGAARCDPAISSSIARRTKSIRAEALSLVRGTVQADILKEDQAQNTCIFSTEFALRMMGDVQQYFIEHGVRNFYSVSISGYHIAEAGANPVSQLAFTLAEWLHDRRVLPGARHEDRRLRAEPVVLLLQRHGPGVRGDRPRRAAHLGARDARPVRRGPRSQMLKYHIQTSGRSLHAREIQFNDIRTTLQALYALFDNCNSLHTNAYDEALTTPTEESVRRAVAIQLIINRELGLNKNQNPWQGSFLDR